jgi:hypothetical protein
MTAPYSGPPLPTGGQYLDTAPAASVDLGRFVDAVERLRQQIAPLHSLYHHATHILQWKQPLLTALALAALLLLCLLPGRIGSDPDPL